MFDAEIKDFVVDATRASTEKHYWDVTRAETSKKEERNRHSASVSSRETEKRHLGSVRFMGELVKFRALDPEWAFDFLKKGVDAFAGRALDAACALLQTWAFSAVPGHRRTDALLDVFLRRKAVSAAPGRAERAGGRGGARAATPPVAARAPRIGARYVAFVVDRLPERPPPGVVERRARGMSRSPGRERRVRRSSRGDDAVRRCVGGCARCVAEHGRCRVAPPEARRVPAGWRARRAPLRRWTGSAHRQQMFVDALLEETAVLAESTTEQRGSRSGVALGRALGEAFVARLVPATAMFAQLYALLVEKTDRANGRRGLTNGPEPGGQARFRKTRPRPRRARGLPRAALVWRRTFSFRRFRKTSRKTRT